MRYFLDQDESCHWYIIPVNKRKAWEDWRNGNQDLEISWEVPEYVIEVGGCHNLVTFSSPKVDE